MANLRDWRWIAKRTQPWADFVSVATAWSLVLLLTPYTSNPPRQQWQSVAFALFAGLAAVSLLARRGLYSGRPTLPRTEEISRLLSSLSITGFTIAALSALVNWPIGARDLAAGILLSIVVRSLVRGVLRDVGSRFSSADTRVPVVIVGAGLEARDLTELIQDHPESRMQFLGIIGHERVATESGLAEVWLGPADRMIELMGSIGAQAAILTATGFRSEQFSKLTAELFSAGFDVHVSTGVNRLTKTRYHVRSLSHEPLVVLRHRRPTSWELATKRGLDVAAASLGLVLATPLLLITALAIKVADRGPVFFRSRRVGTNGETFEMLKFRSMTVDADAQKDQLRQLNQRTGPLFKVTADPRVTRVGRILRDTSIDELPQLVNVLRGEMSLVGPRPALPEEGSAFDDELRSRFKVRPGITGLWQVEARSNASFSAYRRLDLHYVENWSLGLDLRIILATIEQLAVAVLTLPLHLVGGRSVDGVIDLRDGRRSRSIRGSRSSDRQTIVDDAGDSTSDVVIDVDADSTFDVDMDEIRVQDSNV